MKKIVEHVPIIQIMIAILSYAEFIEVPEAYSNIIKAINKATQPPRY